MTFAIRADASLTIGQGHVMRCLTLAQALRHKGAKVTFICREAAGDAIDRVESLGFDTQRLTARPACTWQDDAEETLAAICAGTRPDWLIVDHYALGAAWEKMLRPHVGRLMVIDDLADREHECDLLLDQNLVAGMWTRYDSKVPSGCQLLLGPEFALLQAEYEELHRTVPPRRGPIERILIFFGGGDVNKLTRMAIAAILRLENPNLTVDVVVGHGQPIGEPIREGGQRERVFTFHSGLQTLAPLMAKAQLAVGASGATTWERLCLGLPSLVITVADNQRPIANELQRLGLINLLGDSSDVTEDTLTAALAAQLERGIQEGWSEKCRAAVDGRGAARVTAALTLTAHASLYVRHARPDDETLLLSWANDPLTRRLSFHPEPIPDSTHRAWFQERLGDHKGCRLYVLETDDRIPIGSVRFQFRDPEWEVHYSLAGPYRGKGLGRSLLAAALMTAKRELTPATVVGRVKADNVASRRIFESLGFSARIGSVPEAVIYERAL